MKVAVVGLGYWGPNLVRNFVSSENVSQVFCCDLDPQRVKHITKQFPNVKALSSFEAVLDSDCDAVAIVTPISMHYNLAKQVLERGKHVLVEKPLASSARECDDLIQCADRKKLVLMVDHTFIYTGAVRKIKEIVDRGDVGDLYYLDSVRVNLGMFQHDVNVLWDLAPHDLSIMDYVIGKLPEAVSAVAVNHYNHQEDVAYLILHYGQNIIAHIHVNWLAPVKIRRMLIGGSKKMVVFDDMEPSEKVKIYDSGVKVVTREGIYRTLVEYRTGDMFAPKLDQAEALTLVVKDFVNAISTGKKPVADGCAGWRVVRILEAAEQSLKQSGALVHL